MATLVDLGATTVEAYRLRTGDDTTPASAVSAALVEAEHTLEEELRRRLPSQVRTDAFRIYRNGRIYPDAYPITDAGDRLVDGRAILGVAPDTGPVAAIGLTTLITAGTVEWTGGYTADTLPVTLAHAIYDIAYAWLVGRSAGSSGDFAGATSVRVGDVSITYGSGTSGALDEIVPGLTTRVARYRNRYV